MNFRGALDGWLTGSWGDNGMTSISAIRTRHWARSVIVTSCQPDYAALLRTVDLDADVL